MPTVRLTAKLKRDIERKSNEVLEQQRNSLPPYDPGILKKAVTHFVETYDLGIHGEASMHNKVEFVRFHNLEINGVDVPTDPIECSTVKMILPYACALGRDTLVIDCAERSAYNPPDEVLQEIHIVTKKRQNILAQSHNFESILKSLLKRCTTVKQFIEAWPQGEQFVPSEALQRHYEQENKRRKRGVYLEDDQLSALNETLLTSKLT